MLGHSKLQFLPQIKDQTLAQVFWQRCYHARPTPCSGVALLPGRAAGLWDGAPSNTVSQTDDKGLDVGVSDHEPSLRGVNVMDRFLYSASLQGDSVGVS